MIYNRYHTMEYQYLPNRRQLFCKQLQAEVCSGAGVSQWSAEGSGGFSVNFPLRGSSLGACSDV